MNLWKTLFHCKFHKTCPYYDEDGYTCAHGGGGYCGMFRRLEEEKRGGGK